MIDMKIIILFLVILNSTVLSQSSKRLEKYKSGPEKSGQIGSIVVITIGGKEFQSANKKIMTITKF